MPILNHLVNFKKIRHQRLGTNCALRSANPFDVIEERNMFPSGIFVGQFGKLLEMEPHLLNFDSMVKAELLGEEILTNKHQVNLFPIIS
jgi:hypothetical protein